MRGDGIYLIDEDGRRYVDACGGAAVSCLGHGHPEIIAAIAEQAARLEYAHTGFFTSEASEDLAAVVAESSPGALDQNLVHEQRVGSDRGRAETRAAISSGTRRCRPHQVHCPAPRLSRQHAGSIGGRRERMAACALRADADRRLAGRSLLRISLRRAGETPEAYGRRAADSLEQEILRLGPETVIAFVAETVVGATTGAVPPVPGYLKQIREICTRYGVLMILDEVMCGSGRTGTFMACEQDEVVPDIVTLGKGLGAGYQPIGAVVCTSDVYDAIAAGSGALKHGQTYNAHPVGCAAALAVQRVMGKDGLLTRVREAGVRLNDLLLARFGNHPHVGDIRGRGLLQAIELVADRSSKAPFDPALALHERAKADALARGLLIYPGGGTVDGRSGDHILLAPPYNVTDDELAMIVELLGQTVDSVLPS